MKPDKKELAGDSIVGTKEFLAPEIKTDKIYSVASDIYALGETLRLDVVDKSSPLRPIVDLMTHPNRNARPNLDLVIIAFLAHIHEEDSALVNALKKHKCITTDPVEANKILTSLKNSTSSMKDGQKSNSTKHGNERHSLEVVSEAQGGAVATLTRRSIETNEPAYALGFLKLEDQMAAKMPETPCDLHNLTYC